MSSAQERFEAWWGGADPAPRPVERAFHAGYLAGAEDMRERAAVRCDNSASLRAQQALIELPGEAARLVGEEILLRTEAEAIRALSPSEHSEEKQDAD